VSFKLLSQGLCPIFQRAEIVNVVTLSKRDHWCQNENEEGETTLSGKEEKQEVHVV
jgi:hypothetical protein